MAVQLVGTAELARSHGVKICCYSRAGMGKTVLVATCPKPVMISAESGVLSLAKANLERIFGINTPGITYNIPVIQVTNAQQLAEAHAWAMGSAEAQQFQTVCLDSVSEIAEIVLTNAKGQVSDKRQAYGEMIDKMNMTIKAFRDLHGKHVYMSAKEERSKDESTGGMMGGPMMPGAKLGGQIPYLFDELFHLSKAKDPASGSDYRYLRTQPDFNFEAKDRSGALLEVEVPHIGYLIDKILASN